MVTVQGDVDTPHVMHYISTGARHGMLPQLQSTRSNDAVSAGFCGTEVVDDFSHALCTVESGCQTLVQIATALLRTKLSPMSSAAGCVFYLRRAGSSDTEFWNPIDGGSLTTIIPRKPLAFANRFVLCKLDTRRTVLTRRDTIHTHMWIELQRYTYV
jgi:hypothetical protein